MDPAARDIGFMRQALELAARGGSLVAPNPRVGSVIVKDGQVVGRGWHRQCGGPHAEREALADAGQRARGATLYVTLEPCCHQGRTPPCTDALIGAGIRRVVAAMADPNPRVSGRGFHELRKAGIDVSQEVLRREAEALNLGYLKRTRTGLPYVRCKIAASLDGRTALADGTSQWITSEASRRDVHRNRAESDVIVTGIGTLLADNPQLNVRFGISGPDPLRVVLDTSLRSPPGARLFREPGRALVFTGQSGGDRWRELSEAGAELVSVAKGSGGLALGEVLRQLGDRGHNNLWLEAGPRLSGAFLSGGWVDELVLYLGANLLGQAARPLVELPDIRHMDQRLTMSLREVERLGDDVKMIYVPCNAGLSPDPAGRDGD